MARQYLEDARGPDGVRVTFAVEASGDQRTRDRRAIGDVLPGPHLLLRLWRGVQDPGRGRGPWVVVVEADSGWRARLHLTDRDAAVHLAKSLWHEANEGGLPALEQAVSAAGSPG